MKKIQPKHFRILAIAPSTRGFGFAVLEGQDTLVDWGVVKCRSAVVRRAVFWPN